MGDAMEDEDLLGESSSSVVQNNLKGPLKNTNFSGSSKNTKDKIESKVDAVDIAREAIKSGLDALSGNDSPMLSCIQLGAAIVLQRATGNDLGDCSKEVLRVLKSGAALKRMKK